MSDGSADRPDVVPSVPEIHSHQKSARGQISVPVRVADDFESDLSDRRVIKAVLAVGAGLLFGMAVLGWV